MTDPFPTLSTPSSIQNCLTRFHGNYFFKRIVDKFVKNRVNYPYFCLVKLVIKTLLNNVDYDWWWTYII